MNGGGGGSAVKLVLALGAIFITLGWYVTSIQGGGVKAPSGAGVDPERGEAIFWGKGTCANCHSVGSRGAMARCPNLGEGRDGTAIFERAARRAQEREKSAGRLYTPTDYLVESIAEPNAYVAQGFPGNLMPRVYTGQIDLSADEVMSVVAYLQTLGGDADATQIEASMQRFGGAILNKSPDAADAGVAPIQILDPIWSSLPTDKAKAFSALKADVRENFLKSRLTAAEREWVAESSQSWLAGGRAAFQKYQCWKCHAVAGENFGAPQQGKVGPELSTIGDIQTPQYLLESILNPNAVIVPPLDQHADENGKSKMPDFTDAILSKELMYLVYYMQSLRSGK